MRTSHTNRPLLIITMGDPSGIGPEVTCRSLAEIGAQKDHTVVVVGDYPVFTENCAGLISSDLLAGPIPPDGGLFYEDKINVLDPGPRLNKHRYGHPSVPGARKTLSFLESAVNLIKKFGDERPSAMVTAPVNKEKIASIHKGFVGHTEYLQQAFSRDHVTMALTGSSFSVIPVTRHIPIKDVPANISSDGICRSVEHARDWLFPFTGKTEPIISICSLNPHNGEGGKIGTEEIEIITPAVETIRNNIYPHVRGPVPSDVAFYQAYRKDVDVVVGMYHDQCLAPFKMVEFDTGINVTLGLGFIRTSPDHGTAYDIAGKGIAGHLSMKHAILSAIKALEGRKA
jgi:4-hydroxythreonine-4-phosphate dehydrogenase